MILDFLVDKLSSYLSWLYYRQWKIWELKIAVITIASILFGLLLWLIGKQLRKTKARIELASQGHEVSSVIGVKTGMRMLKKIVIMTIIIIVLIDLGIFCYRRPKPNNGFYLRSQQTGKLIGPVSLPKDYIQPSLDEQTYLVVDPTESELDLRSLLLRNRVTATLTDIPLTEALDHIFTAYFGSKGPPVRIDAADESKLPRIFIDARNTPLYEVLYDCASQAKLHVILEDGTIVLSQKRSESVVVTE